MSRCPLPPVRDRVRDVALALAFGFACTLSPTPLASDGVPDLRLIEFEQSIISPRLTSTDARVTPTRLEQSPALRIETGHRESWPGITVKAPQTSWDLSPYALLVAPVRNTGTNRVTIHCRVDNPGADGIRACITRSVTVAPGTTNLLRVDLRRAGESRLGDRLFGMRGYPVAAGGEGTINPSNIIQFLVFVSKPDADHVFEVGEFVATGAYTPPTAWVTDAEPFMPLIDTFGQYRHKTWPGKTADLVALRQQAEVESKQLSQDSGPAGWDRFGGWAAGPQLQATGYFRTERHQDRWWLVDPEGHLFWSHGIDCVQMLDATPIAGREAWFADFIGKEPEFAGYLQPNFVLKGHYAGQSPACFSFAGANLHRKYGANWRELYADRIHRRLRAWGLNTIGNWSDERVAHLRRTPYTDSIGSDNVRMVAGSEGYWGKFPDVFDPGFRASLRRQMAGKTSRSANDPWCLGYFSDNEMSWGDDVSLALAALASPADQPAKRAFLADLQARHTTIGALNQAWGTSHASWDALAASTQQPERARAQSDLQAFYTRTAEEYFRTVREVIREGAPHQLYLGCRFAWVNDRAAAAAAKYCDVVSYNLYVRSVADFRFNGGKDMPLLIGEFHFGALDRGMFHTGLVPVENQTARAQAYTDYVRGAARHPSFVGCHWFQYQDEPTTGRAYDEENYQIGFVDIADTPYAETVRASRTVAEGLYRLRASE